VSRISAAVSVQQGASKYKRRAPSCSLLEEWNLGQDRRLDQVFGFFCVFVRIHQLAAGIHQARGHEDDEVTLDVLLRVRPEEAAWRFWSSQLHSLRYPNPISII